MTSNDPFQPPGQYSSTGNASGSEIPLRLWGFSAVLTLALLTLLQYSKTRSLANGGLQTQFGLPPCLTFSHHTVMLDAFSLKPLPLAANLLTILTLSALLTQLPGRSEMVSMRLWQHKTSLVVVVICSGVLGVGELYGLRSIEPQHIVVPAMYVFVFTGVCLVAVRSESLVVGAIVPLTFLITHGAAQRVADICQDTYVECVGGLSYEQEQLLLTILLTALPCLVIILRRLRIRSRLSSTSQHITAHDST